MRCHSLDSVVRLTIPTIEKGEMPPFSAAIHARRLLNILSAWNSETVELEFICKRVMLKDEGVDYRLPSLDPTDLPEIPEIDGASTRLSGPGFKRALKGAASCACRDDSRPAYSCIFLEFKEGMFGAVGTDGHRMAVMPKVPVIIPAQFPESILLHREHAINLCSMIEGATEVAIKMNARHLHFAITPGENERYSNFEFWCTSAHHRYPDYRKIISKLPEVGIHISRERVLRSITRTAAILEKEYTIGLKTSEEGLDFSANSQTYGESLEHIELDEEFLSTEVFFNPIFFSDALREIDGDSFELCVHDGHSPIALKANGAIFVVMPFRPTEKKNAA